jgi:glycosyltransferase involved in cell wall biosynthesis
MTSGLFMRILQVAQRTHPAKGGVELHTAKISELLARKGHQVTLVVLNSLDMQDCGFGISYQKPYVISKPRKPVLPQEEYWHGVRILRFKSKLQLFSYYWSPSMLAWLLENADEYDVMHTHCLRFSNNEFTALAHTKSKTPFAVTGHDQPKLDYLGRLALAIDGIYRPTLGRLVLNMADRVIAFDEDYAEDLHNLYRVPYENIRIISNGVDYAYYSNLPNGSQLRETLGNPEYLLLYIGRFIESKNPDLLITSFKSILERFPKSCLLMIGKDYGLLPRCRDLVAALGLQKNVIFVEDTLEQLKCSHEQMKLQALAIADVCIIPSDYESFSLVAIEAQAAGVPVVASYVGGLKHVVLEGKTGLFLKDRTTAEIVETTSSLLRNERLRSEMRVNAKKHAKNYSWDLVTDSLLDVYEEMLQDCEFIRKI